MAMSFGNQPAPKPRLGEALAQAKQEGTQMEQRAASKTREFFGKAWDTAKRFASVVDSGVKVGLGMTKPETRKLLAEAVGGELDRAGEAVVDKLESVAEDYEIRRQQLVEGARNAWRNFENETLQPLSNNIDEVANIVLATIEKLPGLAVEKGEQAFQRTVKNAFEAAQPTLQKYADMANDWVNEQAVKVNQFRANGEEVIEVVGGTVTKLPGVAYRDIIDTLEARKNLKAAEKAEKRAKKIEVYLHQRERLEKMVVSLHAEAEQKRSLAAKADGSLFGGSTRLRAAALEQAAAGAAD